ncbi:hypothetical protein HYD47_03815 [Mycoplasmopsis bovis]|nr:hypothetical protein [Mycoplasmopsis bovis]QQH78079.1 hypothetical protein HYD47_03815 [Mycoplasmopsis bovis]
MKNISEDEKKLTQMKILKMVLTQDKNHIWGNSGKMIKVHQLNPRSRYRC